MLILWKGRLTGQGKYGPTKYILWHKGLRFVFLAKYSRLFLNAFVCYSMRLYIRKHYVYS